jgi:hypothetical protein
MHQLFSFVLSFGSSQTFFVTYLQKFLLLLSVVVLLEPTLVCCHLMETNFETTPLRLVLIIIFVLIFHIITTTKVVHVHQVISLDFE